MSNKKRLIADIPSELKRKVKIHCAKTGLNIQEITELALTMYLEKAEKQDEEPKADIFNKD